MSILDRCFMCQVKSQKAHKAPRPSLPTWFHFLRKKPITAGQADDIWKIYDSKFLLAFFKCLNLNRLSE